MGKVPPTKRRTVGLDSRPGCYTYIKDDVAWQGPAVTRAGAGARGQAELDSVTTRVPPPTEGTMDSNIS